MNNIEDEIKDCELQKCLRAESDENIAYPEINDHGQYC